MNERELRAALRAEVDDVQMTSDASDRLETRLALADRRPVRGMALAGVVVVLLAALVAGVLVAVRDPDSRPSPAGPAARSMPHRIVAVTARSELVVLDARRGRTIRTLARNVGTFRGDPEIAVSADGAQIYYTAVGAPTPGCATSGIESVFRVPARGGTPALVGRGRVVAVGPAPADVAFARDYENCRAGPGALELRRGSSRRVITQQPSDPATRELALDHLGWSGDGRFLSFDWARNDVPRPYVLASIAPAMVRARCLCRAPKSAESFGFLGRSRRVIAATASGATRQYAEDAVVLRDDGSIDRTLFRWHAAITGLQSDAFGRHFTMISPTKKLAHGDGFVLYRSSVGDAKPTKVRDGIVAAAWIPDPWMAER